MCTCTRVLWHQSTLTNKHLNMHTCRLTHSQIPTHTQKVHISTHSPISVHTPRTYVQTLNIRSRTLHRYLYTYWAAYTHKHTHSCAHPYPTRCKRWDAFVNIMSVNQIGFLTITWVSIPWSEADSMRFCFCFACRATLSSSIFVSVKVRYHFMHRFMKRILPIVFFLYLYQVKCV